MESQNEIETFHIQLELDESDRADLDDKRNVTIRCFTNDPSDYKERTCAVFDESAIEASTKLYSMLSIGNTLIEALSSTYRYLMTEKIDDWHLLRLHLPQEDVVAVPEALVTDDGAVREPSIYKPITQQFGHQEIVSPEKHVGRRRVIQTCLRALKNDELSGILITGLGGIGKTALAARLCDRLAPEYQCLVLSGKIDERKLVRALRSSVGETPELDELLKSKQSLSLRLKQVFSKLQKSHVSMLIVLDAFETNLELRNEKFILHPGAREVLEALKSAILNVRAEVNIKHRLIITSRYKFSFESLQNQPLRSLRSADFFKKYKQCDLKF